MNLQYVWVLVAWLSLGLLQTPSAFAQASEMAVPKPSVELKPLAKGSPFEFPVIRTLEGRVIEPSYWKGKVVIIERWASWCPYCARQNVNMNGLHQSFKAAGLEVLALSVDKQPDAALDYMRDKGYAFHAAMMTSEFRSRLGQTKILPEIWVIGRDGRFKEYIPGEMFPENVEHLATWLKK